MKILKSTTAKMLCLLWIVSTYIGANAQATASMPAVPVGTVLIGNEGIIIASTSGTNVVYQFGAGTSFESVSGVSYPLIADCSKQENCAKLGTKDPAAGLPKKIYAVEQATAYTVTLNDGTVVQVPANPALNPPPPATLKTWSCTGTITYSLMSDGTFSLGNTGSLVCKEVSSAQ